jgi:hypothetical protein
MASDPQPCGVDAWPSAAARLELAYPGPHFVVFTADVVDGVAWCGDCRRALPVLRGVVWAFQRCGVGGLCTSIYLLSSALADNVCLELLLCSCDHIVLQGKFRFCFHNVFARTIAGG